MRITVHGQPAPQGSMVRGRFGGVHSSSKSLATWREAVRHEAAEVRGDTLHGPAIVTLTFSMRKPKSAKAGASPIKRPDLDKLCRAVFDALTDAGVWDDDSQVVSLMAWKLYAGDDYALDRPGVDITIQPVDLKEAAAFAKVEPEIPSGEVEWSQPTGILRRFDGVRISSGDQKECAA